MPSHWQCQKGLLWVLPALPSRSECQGGLSHWKLPSLPFEGRSLPLPWQSCPLAVPFHPEREGRRWALEPACWLACWPALRHPKHARHALFTILLRTLRPNSKFTIYTQSKPSIKSLCCTQQAAETHLCTGLFNLLHLVFSYLRVAFRSWHKYYEHTYWPVNNNPVWQWMQQAITASQ